MRTLLSSGRKFWAPDGLFSLLVAKGLLGPQSYAGSPDMATFLMKEALQAGQGVKRPLSPNLVISTLCDFEQDITHSEPPFFWVENIFLMWWYNMSALNTTEWYI